MGYASSLESNHLILPLKTNSKCFLCAVQMDTQKERSENVQWNVAGSNSKFSESQTPFHTGYNTGFQETYKPLYHVSTLLIIDWFSINSRDNQEPPASTRWDSARLDWLGNGPTLPRATNGCQTFASRTAFPWCRCLGYPNAQFQWLLLHDLDVFFTRQKKKESKFNGKSLDSSMSWYLEFLSCLLRFW